MQIPVYLIVRLREIGREIRRVPINWAHPKKIINRRGVIETIFRPMHDGDYVKALQESIIDQNRWFKDQKLWEQGKYRNHKGEEKDLTECFKEWGDTILEQRKEWGEDYREQEYQMCMTGLYSFTDFAGDPPRLANPEDYMPSGDWYQLYETVSEGTPLSPPFETKKELVDWLASNKDYWGSEWSYEAAQDIVNTGYAASMIASNGKLYEPHEQHLLRDNE